MFQGAKFQSLHCFLVCVIPWPVVTIHLQYPSYQVFSYPVKWVRHEKRGKKICLAQFTWTAYSCASWLSAKPNWRCFCTTSPTSAKEIWPPRLLLCLLSLSVFSCFISPYLILYLLVIHLHASPSNDWPDNLDTLIHSLTLSGKRTLQYFLNGCLYWAGRSCILSSIQC